MSEILLMKCVYTEKSRDGPRDKKKRELGQDEKAIGREETSID